MSDLAWLIDGNNVFGSRPDGWWNDPQAAMRRLAQRVAEWCRTHDDPVTLVFDGPVGDDTVGTGRRQPADRGGTARGRDAADDLIVELAQTIDRPRVVTADRGLRQRLIDTCGERVEMIGVGRFRELVGY